MFQRVLTKNSNLVFVSKRHFFQQAKFDRSKDYYLTLGVSRDATDSELKRAYYKLAKEYHPDHNKGTQHKFKEINEAYEILSDESTRRQYDSSRTFGKFTSGMGSRAQEGNFRYQEYQSYYENMSSQEQEQIRQQAQIALRKIALFFGGFLLFWMLFTRRPSQAYAVVDGQLRPIQMQYPHHHIGQYQQGPYQGPPQGSYGPEYGQAPYGNVPNYPSPYNAQGMHAQYYPSRSQNQYEQGHIQSNYK